MFSNCSRIETIEFCSFRKYMEGSYERRGTKGKTRGKKAGGMVKSYATGGSVSGGQYPAQARKVKFKGVF